MKYSMSGNINWCTTCWKNVFELHLGWIGDLAAFQSRNVFFLKALSRNRRSFSNLQTEVIGPWIVPRPLTSHTNIRILPSANAREWFRTAWKTPNLSLCNGNVTILSRPSPSSVVGSTTQMSHSLWLPGQNLRDALPPFHHQGRRHAFVLPGTNYQPILSSPQPYPVQVIQVLLTHRLLLFDRL